MWEFDTEVIEIIQRTPSIKSFRLGIHARGVRYVAGQFFFLTLKIKGEDAMHHFSFSSSPTEKGYIEFTKRITSSEFSQALARLENGGWAHLRGPVGYFTLPAKPGKLAYLSGGIGITPVRSMLRYIADRNLSHDVVLLYGNSCPEEIAFRDDLDNLAATVPRLRVEHILSGPGVPPDWNGKTGRINKDLVVELVPDYLTRVFYLSGPPGMVNELDEALMALGIPSNKKKWDAFTGYD